MPPTLISQKQGVCFCNFTLINQGLDHIRFYVDLLHHPGEFDFNDMDAFLKGSVTPLVWQQTRRLKLTINTPEAGAINYHCWLRIQGDLPQVS
ncbi:hypothetical protein [Leptolyngbya sp. PCC 6406]|uniref:hypothetical protein n=1 Tax=Leptolyngbya sp. PCC 6406 TaxID=1173264 RepID=UPI0002ABEC95|nr:hypothetical protein [Leptolyngbya sp. PCC 6406]